MSNATSPILTTEAIFQHLANYNDDYIFYPLNGEETIDLHTKWMAFDEEHTDYPQQQYEDLTINAVAFKQGARRYFLYEDFVFVIDALQTLNGQDIDHHSPLSPETLHEALRYLNEDLLEMSDD